MFSYGSKFLGKRCDNFWPQNVMMMDTLSIGVDVTKFC